MKLLQYNAYLVSVVLSQHCGYQWPGALLLQGFVSQSGEYHSGEYASICFQLFKG